MGSYEFVDLEEVNQGCVEKPLYPYKSTYVLVWGLLEIPKRFQTHTFPFLLLPTINTICGLSLNTKRKKGKN